MLNQTLLAKRRKAVDTIRILRSYVLLWHIPLLLLSVFSVFNSTGWQYHLNQFLIIFWLLLMSYSIFGILLAKKELKKIRTMN